MTQYVRNPRKRWGIVDLHDCLSYLGDQRARFEPRLVRKLASLLDNRSVARWERSLQNTFTAVVLNSAIDASVYRTLAPAARTVVISNGVDTEYYTPGNGLPRQPVLIFTGVMDYGPNEDAATFLCREIFPRIRREVAEAELWIVGPNPTPGLQSLAIQPGIHILGLVPDLRPYLQRATVFVSPLRYGAGMKNKVLTALAMRLPVVATTTSLANIDVQPGRDVLVADEPQAFAAHVTDLLRDTALAARLAARGRAVVVEKYSWKQSAAQLEDLISRDRAESSFTPGESPTRDPETS
jgi:glycosyltransferase involved in cell wall biosynthesis